MLVLKMDIVFYTTIDSIKGTNNSEKQFSSNASKPMSMGSPGGAVVKNPPAKAGYTGSSPAPGRSHMPRSN